MTIGRTWALWADENRGTHWHVGARRWVELHGLPRPAVPVLVEEWTGDARAAEVTHYGWEYADKPGDATMIWPRARGDDTSLSPWMSLDMCFAYGMQAEVDRGRGRMLALRITERTIATNEDPAGGHE